MVIQRWQSLLLLAAAVAMACFASCTIGQISTADYSLALSSLGFSYEGIPTGDAPSGWFQHTWYFFAVAILGTILPLSAIFMFKNFRLQKQLTIVSMLLSMAGFCIALLLGYNAIDESAVSWNYSVLCAPVIAVVALWLAWRYICRDQRLLASTDRLR